MRVKIDNLIINRAVLLKVDILSPKTNGDTTPPTLEITLDDYNDNFFKYHYIFNCDSLGDAKTIITDLQEFILTDCLHSDTIDIDKLINDFYKLPENVNLKLREVKKIETNNKYYE